MPAAYGEATSVKKLLLWKTRAPSFLQDVRGAVAFEYVLIIGAVSTVIVFAITVAAPILMNSALSGVCSAVYAIPGITVDCTIVHNHPFQSGHPVHGWE